MNLTESYDNISHNVFTEKGILRSENELLQTLDFQFDIVTPFQFISTIILIVKTIVNDEHSNQLFSCLEVTSIQYAKMSLVNKDL